MADTYSGESRRNSIQAHDANGYLPSTQVTDKHSPAVAPLFVSVIIPAFNEEKLLGRCLDSLAAATFPEDAFEVIVVDNGSIDRTLEIAQSFSGRLQITALKIPGVNISTLRNRGAKVAKGEILAFLDADCSVPANWFELAERNLATDPSGIIGGDYDVPEHSSWVARTLQIGNYIPDDGEVTFVPSGNMLMRKSTFLQIGGFNEHLKTSEDCELCFRAKKATRKVRAIRAMAVTHWTTPQTLPEFYRKQVWHGTHVAKVLFENIRDMANLRAVAFSVYMLLCCASAIIGAVLAIFYHQLILLELAVAGMIFGPLLWSIRKMRYVHGVRFWAYLIPLTLVNLTWGFARARSLISIRAASRRVEVL